MTPCRRNAKSTPSPMNPAGTSAVPGEITWMAECCEAGGSSSFPAARAESFTTARHVTRVDPESTKIPASFQSGRASCGGDSNLNRQRGGSPTAGSHLFCSSGHRQLAPCKRPCQSTSHSTLGPEVPLLVREQDAPVPSGAAENQWVLLMQEIDAVRRSRRSGASASRRWKSTGWSRGNWIVGAGVSSMDRPEGCLYGYGLS